MNKLLYIAFKEIRHILRDTRSLIIAILMPITMTFLYGYAINLDIKNIKLAIMDYDQSRESRDLMGRFYNTGYFVRPDAEAILSNPERVLRSSQAHAVLTITRGFAKAVQNKEKFQLGLLVDGADANMSAAASSYADVVLMQFIKESLPENFEIPGVQLSPQILYNPDMKSSHFFVPGLIAVILMMISALLTSITIAREKETGTMEQLLTAPVGPPQIIFGKIIPYIALAGLDGFLVWGFGVFHFGVPMAGSLALLSIFSVIYIIAALSLGVFISTISKTQQVAMMLAMVATMLPSVMLSGFIFEIKNMPLLLQYISHIVSAKYFILIIRGIMLKGSGLGVLWPQAAALVILTVIFLGVAAKRFKIKIG